MTSTPARAATHQVPAPAERAPRWREKVVYEVFVRSFADSNADGIGDLPGVMARLEYLHWLGVDLVWLTAMYPSPLVDCGYDISDHCAVHPEYGTLEDFDALLQEAHRLGLGVLVDYVPAHTSDAHPWFQAAASSRADLRHAWYVWHDGIRDHPPNNWTAEFGGSAWTWYDSVGRYCLHRFCRQQPCVNWRNPGLREAMLDVLRFWLDRGVDGFRVDAANLLLADAAFRDNPPMPDGGSGLPSSRHFPAYTEDQPGNVEIVRAMRAVVDEHRGAIVCGELHLQPAQAVRYYSGDEGFHFPLNYRLASVTWSAPDVRLVVDELEGFIPEDNWPSWALGNHDQVRVMRRTGAAGARLAAMLLLTLRGVPVLYYGDEIGLLNDDIPPERMQDITGRTLRPYGVWRDAYRTPMQWDDSPQAGFSANEPWLPVAPDFARCNVARQRSDAASLLTLYRQLIHLHADEVALQCGSYRPLHSDTQSFVYARDHGSDRFVVALNFSPNPAEFEADRLAPDATIVLSTHPHHSRGQPAPAWLRSHEGIILEA